MCSASKVDYGNSSYLQTELMTMWGQLCREHPGTGKGKRGAETPKKEAARCSQLYKNTMASNLSFVVLGETSIREDETLLKNLGTIATDPAFNQKTIRTYLSESLRESSPKKIKMLAKSHLTQGAVLNEGNWFILPNDMVVLGLIHSGKECHVATEEGKLPSDDTLWDQNERRPRVLGRELLQLYHSGYRLVKESLDRKQLIFLRVDKKLAKETTLTALRRRAVCSSISDIHDIFQETVPYRETEKGKKELH